MDGWQAVPAVPEFNSMLVRLAITWGTLSYFKYNSSELPRSSEPMFQAAMPLFIPCGTHSVRYSAPSQIISKPVQSLSAAAGGSTAPAHLKLKKTAKQQAAPRSRAIAVKTDGTPAWALPVPADPCRNALVACKHNERPQCMA